MIEGVLIDASEDVAVTDETRHSEALQQIKHRLGLDGRVLIFSSDKQVCR